MGSDGHFNLESSYARAFRELGWTVNFWDPATALHRVARGHQLGRLFSTFVNVEPWLRKANLHLIELASELQPTLILVIATSGVRAGSLAQLRVQLPNTILYCIFPDTPHNLIPDRIQCLPFFDRTCTVSPAWVDAFERLGAKRVCFLPLASDPELHKPAISSRNAIPQHDVAFVGNWRSEREALLERLVDFDLCVWGSKYWTRNTSSESPLRACYGGRPLFGAEFAQACSHNRIMLNLIDGVGWPGPNMRTFEQPACRAFSLVTRTPAVLDVFTEGENIECFDSVEEARDKIRYYLANEDARCRIADASYKFVIEAGHTYQDRARQLIVWMREDAKT